MTMTKTRKVKAEPEPAPLPAFTIDRQEFATAVGKVARTLPDRPPVPVLGGILIEVDALGVTLTVTDYEELARVFVAAEVGVPGRFLVKGEDLARITRNLTGDKVDVQLVATGTPATVTLRSPDGATAVVARQLQGTPTAMLGGGRVQIQWSSAEHITITDGRSLFRLITMPTEDYPDMSKVIEDWRNADAPVSGDDPTCRVLDMDKVRPVAADGRERELCHKRGLETVKFWRGPRALRDPKPYSPTGLQVGAFITWKRYTETRRHLTDGRVLPVGETVIEEVTGQVWCPYGPRTVWAVVEGEAAPSRVSENTYGNGKYGVEYKRYTVLEERVYIRLDAEGNVKPAEAA